MNNPIEVSLLRHFEGVEDPRDNRGKEHNLLDIIVIAICAVISGGENWEDIALFGESKQDWLGTFLQLPNGIPCDDTFARVFARLNPQQMQNSFISWVKSVSQVLKGEVVAIDGKTLKHSYDRGADKGAIHMVSAWASANRLVLGQSKVNEKSNEITAIPELLKLLDINGCIVTIDAMGCQKEIASQIIEQGADYVLALKGNQGGLFEDVQWLFQQAINTDFVDVDHDFCQSIDKGHGRLEIRRCWTLSNLDYLTQLPLWSGLQTIALVQSERRINGKVSTENRYYISSLPSNAALIANAVRTHWSIENSLHWVLDVSFHEDASRIRKDNSPENMAMLRHFALNLLSRDKSSKFSMRAKRNKAAWDLAYLNRLLNL
ncbi:MAG: ISAs1 family transposase [Pseudanabaena sp. Salubria-1]|nr:ISAs1 family transposase [Pseudanabaena sp. Salubria-1]MCL1494589.1 ISAs1 family transposase [Pseudanabaena sp. Salubria-1]